MYLTLTTDPTNPNIVYLGSFGGDNHVSDTGLVRVDATNIWDAHSLVAYSDSAKDGGHGESELDRPGRRQHRSSHSSPAGPPVLDA